MTDVMDATLADPDNTGRGADVMDVASLPDPDDSHRLLCTVQTEGSFVIFRLLQHSVTASQSVRNNLHLVLLLPRLLRCK